MKYEQMEVEQEHTLANADRVSQRKPVLLLVGPLPPPYIGPAVATARLLESHVLRSRFSLEFLDTSDPSGLEEIGKLGLRNVITAFRHGFRCLRLLVSHRPEVMYVPIARGLWGFIRDLLFLLPARLLGTKVIVHLRAGRFDINHDNGLIGRMIARIGLNGVTRGVVLGQSLRGVFADLIPASRLRVVPNGISLKGWDAEAWQYARESFGIFRIAYVSNLYRDKGIHVMLQAMPHIREVVSDVRVSFAGEWYDQEYREYCLGLVEAHDLYDVVEFLDVLKDDGKRALLSSVHLAVFVPVAPEGLPWVVLEAMAAALPVIGTTQGAMGEVIVNGETGFLIPTEDPHTLAERVILLANDRETARELGANGRARVEEEFSEEVAHRKLADVALEAIS